MEKIGNVILNDAYYPGEDLYSDGAVEDRILELVQEYPEKEYNQVIAQEQDWAVMYHLSHERGNILSWYPFREGTKVLEIGSGCGAVTGVAASAAGTVTCVDLSMKRSRINGVRNQKKGNIEVLVGNFKDIEAGLDKDFDYATLIGVFEYGKGYIGGEKPYHEFLTTIMEHLKPGGRLLVAIENKFGLKYWAGCTEDHTGNFSEGLEGYQKASGVRTFTKPEWERMMKECGCRHYRFYYPYPDYKFPFLIFSDEYLPKPGELNRNLCNFDRKRMIWMDEGKVFDQILENNLFPLYSNSFFIEITKEGAEAGQEPEQVIYTKYSAGRAPEFSVQTRIVKEKTGKMLYKKAEYPQGKEHICRIVQAGEALGKLWKEKGMFQANHCEQKGEKLFFEYLDGITLEEKLDRLLEEEKADAAKELIGAAVSRIRESSPAQRFRMTPEFQKVFGNAAVTEGEPALEISDIDLIFSNILLTEDGSWHVLDYEWTFFFPVPLEFIVYRALYYYLESSANRKILKEDLKLYEIHGITEDKKTIYEAMEQSFQNYIAGNHMSAEKLYHRMGKRAIPLGEILAETDRRRMQVYLDYGQGFSEEQSFFLEQGCSQCISCTVQIPKEAVGVWIDPALGACILRDVKLCWREEGGREELPAQYSTTGFEMEKNCYLFDNSDPKIIIEEIPQGKRQIAISYQISMLEEETAVLLMDKVNTRGRMKKKVRGLLKG